MTMPCTVTTWLPPAVRGLSEAEALESPIFFDPGELKPLGIETWWSFEGQLFKASPVLHERLLISVRITGIEATRPQKPRRHRVITPPAVPGLSPEEAQANAMVTVRDFSLDDPDERVWLCRGIKVKLSRQLHALLALLCSHPGELVDQSTLAQAVWGEDWHERIPRRTSCEMARLREAIGIGPYEVFTTVTNLGIMVQT